LATEGSDGAVAGAGKETCGRRWCSVRSRASTRLGHQPRARLLPTALVLPVLLRPIRRAFL